MGNSILILSVLLTFIFFLIPLTFADTTFFDNPDDVFIIADNSESSAVVVGEVVSSGGGHCIIKSWNCGNWSECFEEMQNRSCRSNCATRKTEEKNCSVGVFEGEDENENIDVEEEFEISSFYFIIGGIIILFIILIILIWKFRKIR